MEKKAHQSLPFISDLKSTEQHIASSDPIITLEHVDFGLSLNPYHEPFNFYQFALGSVLDQKHVQGDAYAFMTIRAQDVLEQGLMHNPVGNTVKYAAALASSFVIHSVVPAAIEIQERAASLISVADAVDRPGFLHDRSERHDHATQRHADHLISLLDHGAFSDNPHTHSRALDVVMRGMLSGKIHLHSTNLVNLREMQALGGLSSGDYSASERDYFSKEKILIRTVGERFSDIDIMSPDEARTFSLIQGALGSHVIHLRAYRGGPELFEQYREMLGDIDPRALEDFDSRISELDSVRRILDSNVPHKSALRKIFEGARQQRRNSRHESEIPSPIEPRPVHHEPRGL